MPNPQPAQMEERMELKAARRLAEEFVSDFTPGGSFTDTIEEAFEWLQDRSIGPLTRPAADPGEYGELDLPPMLYSEADQDDVPARLRPHLKAAADRLETQAATIARLRHLIWEMDEKVDGCCGCLGHLDDEFRARIDDAALSPNPTSP